MLLDVAYEAGNDVEVDEHTHVTQYGVKDETLTVIMEGGKKRKYNMDKVIWYGR